jgi:hypothetical protein
MTCYETLSVIAYFLTAAATAIYAYFALGQWKEIRRQADIATKGIEVNRIAADAAQKSANTAETSLKKIGRAYLHVTHWQLFNFEPGKDAYAMCFIATAGQRPSILKGNFSDFCFSEKLPPIPNYIKIPSTYNGEPITIHPGMSTGLKCTIPKEKVADHYETVRNGKERLYFYGYFTYEDPIDGEHKTTFFAWYDLSKGGGQFSQVYDLGYNTSD